MTDRTVRINRRGACPALAAPMQTGDGLLARLNPVSQGLTPAQMTGLCHAAEAHGNGTIEITSRGSLQVRGLTEMSALDLADDIDGLFIAVQTGNAVAAGPLAGLDAREVADPRPLANTMRAAIARRGLSARLAPKVSVVVDGGGLWSLNGLQADLRCVALERELWRVEIASEGTTTRLLGTFGMAEAGEAAMHVLEELAQLGRKARARDLPGPAPQARDAADGNPLGRLDLGGGRAAVAVGLPFGAVQAGALARFAAAAAKLGAVEFRPAPPRSLIILLDAPNADALLATAAGLGLVTDARDPIMHIFACPGAPACSFGHFDTRAIAHDIALSDGLFAHGDISVHVSGCIKGCAHPAAATLTLVGGENSVGIVVGGTARDLPLVHSSRMAVADELVRLVDSKASAPLRQGKA